MLYVLGFIPLYCKLWYLKYYGSVQFHISRKLKPLNSLRNSNHQKHKKTSLLPQIQQFLRSLRETGTDRHQKALYDICIISPARNWPWVKLTGIDLVPARYRNRIGTIRDRSKHRGTDHHRPLHSGPVPALSSLDKNQSIDTKKDRIHLRFTSIYREILSVNVWPKAGTVVLNFLKNLK